MRVFDYDPLDGLKPDFIYIDHGDVFLRVGHDEVWVGCDFMGEPQTSYRRVICNGAEFKVYRLSLESTDLFLSHIQSYKNKGCVKFLDFAPVAYLMEEKSTEAGVYGVSVDIEEAKQPRI